MEGKLEAMNNRVRKYDSVLLLLVRCISICCLVDPFVINNDRFFVNLL